ncbi:hypothetical protein SEPCBS57363_003830 [Sporothrix epigloea]|uniref:Meiotic recombination protein DMC1 n=1 Tax=Sporothrix epigloea TaxID=1892477 RepID=A0ABP0DRF6_9PEZI
MADAPKLPVSQEHGGFIQASTSCMSSSPSNASISRPNNNALGLPHPRRHPFRPGSVKEDLVRRYISDQLLQISRRFVKKDSIATPGNTSIGYRSMGELCRDVDALLNSLWQSGTRKHVMSHLPSHIFLPTSTYPSLPAGLQVQYLLSIANELITWMDGFKPSPRATLNILRKLDFCFASLLIGEDLETHETLPGFEQGGSTNNRRVGLSRTDIVRCRSIAEQSRIAVVDVFRRGPPDPLDDEGAVTFYPRSNCVLRTDREGTANTDASTLQGDDVDDGCEKTAEPTDDDATTLAEETDDDDDGYPVDYEDNEDMQMGVARVYENTLIKSGEILGELPGRIGDFAPGRMDVSDDLEEENDDEY